ncbi:MAG: T9SS type A sorting domain-containing protein [Bacteroidales bacterium]|jgi:hypothetical protein|nr:T9SS type A sorting domain-containing protein [Bacteroidales bacterium]
MKNLIIILIAFVAYTSSYAQQLEYTYDAAGNRIKREYIILPQPPPIKSVQDSSAVEPSIVSFGEMEIRIFPNPTKGMLMLQIANMPEQANCQLILVDMLGREVFSSVVTDRETQIDLSNQARGNYILSLFVDNRRKEWIVVKE